MEQEKNITIKKIKIYECCGNIFKKAIIKIIFENNWKVTDISSFSFIIFSFFIYAPCL